MKLKKSSEVDVSDLLSQFGAVGAVSLNIDESLEAALENPLSTFTDEELVAELLRRTSLGKELE